MSKIGRKYITIPARVVVDLKGSEIQYKGPLGSGAYHLPAELQVTTENGRLFIKPAATEGVASTRVKELWGLHRALLAAALHGAGELFVRNLKIVGLGFKAIVRGSSMEFSLGYSHKIPFELPAGVTATVDKTGQKLALSSVNNELVGLVASQIRDLRKPEPYKGTGIMYENEIIHRKAGKAK